MKKLRFSGYSDDTFGEYGVFNEDDDDCANHTIRTYEVRSGKDFVYVCGVYAPQETPGFWFVGIQADEDHPLPKWPMYFQASERPYSPELVIEAPDEVTVRLVGP